MREQLLHLIEQAQLPNVTLQVIPYTAGQHAGMDGAFDILSFEEPGDPDVVHLENATSQLYLERPDEVRRYSMIFDHLRAVALAPDDSSAFLTELAKESVASALRLRQLSVRFGLSVLCGASHEMLLHIRSPV